MTIQICCPKCEQTYQVRDELAGKRMKCSGCGTAIAIEIAAATDEDFEDLLDDAVESEQQAETFDIDNRRRRGKTVFRIGQWPWVWETEIVRDEEGLYVETRRIVCGLIASSAEIDPKDLTTVKHRVVPLDGWMQRNRKKLILCAVLMFILMILVIMPRDWALRQLITGIARDMAKVVFIVLLIIVVAAILFGAKVMRMFYLRELFTSAKHHQTRYKTKAMTSMTGSWRARGMDGQFFVTLSVQVGRQIPLYCGYDPEEAGEAVKRAVRITGLPVERVG